jgi:hypothetical protein
VPREGRALASVIGPEALLQLIECRGGTSVHIGEAAKPSKKLGEKLGLDARTMAALRRTFGKQRLKVPLLRPWRARIYRGRGLSYAEIALKLGVSDSAVHVYLRDAGLTRQLALDV